MSREWRCHSAKVRDELGKSAAFSGWTSLPTTKMHGLPPTPRNLDILDCAWAHRLSQASPDATVASLVKDFWANPSQGVQRHPWTTGGGVLTPRSIWYSFEKDSCLDAVDFLRLQGLPTRVDTTTLSDSELRDLAGDGYPCPLIAMAFLALYYQPLAVWWSPGEAP